MLDDLVKMIPQSVRNQPGRALYSGRQAFAGPSDLYIIDYHPGRSPEESTEKVREQIDRVLNHPPQWSAYVDEQWDRKPPGSRPQQRRLNHLFEQLGLNPQAVPAAPLIFRRWDPANEPSGAERRQWADECWPFHQAVIDRLEVKIVVCLGSYARYWVLKKERELTGVEPQQIDSFTAKDKAARSSYAYQSGNRYIVTLTHPTRTNWINPNADPTELVKRTLDKVRG